MDDARLVFSVGCGHEFQAHQLVQGGLPAGKLTAFAIDGMLTMLDHLQRYGWPTILEGVRSGVAAAAPAGGGGSVSEQLRLAAERYLEDLIVEQWAGIDFGADLAFVDRQVSCGRIGIIDILARDRATDGFVVIELKRDQGDDEAFGQLSRYMGWVAGNMPQPEGVNVAGIIIAAEITPKLEAAARTNADVRLMEYAVGLQLRSADEGHVKKGQP
ncbi:MAG: DUF1016 family protein [Phycisphaerales bacterium]|nr:MAG: DUF1016 family protein [Phycisphaerales bacterium]